jgi:MtN3 and saliva related transmembrane protein
LTSAVLELALTVVAVALAVTQPVPQVMRMLRTRSIAGLSGSTTWLGLTINSAWVAYGIGRGLLPVAVLSGAYVVGYATVGGLLLRHGMRRGTGTAVLAAVGLAGFTLVAGWAALGTTLALAVGVQFVPQVVQAWRSPDLSGLSAGTYWVCALDGAIWGAYGLVMVDLPLVLYGVVMLAVAVLVLVPRRRWARRTAIAPLAAPSAGMA